jgi:hypothetical protein
VIRDPGAYGHVPDESATVKVTCAASGDPDEYADWQRPATLADLEAFVAELRRLGAPGDTPVANAIGLRVTLSFPLP